MSNFWDQKYTVNPDGFGSEPNEFLRANSHLLKPGSDVYVPGDGYGRNSLWLARQGHRVTMVERSSVGLHMTEETAHKEGLSVKTVFADLADYHPEPCDAVVIIYVHLPPEGREFMHRQIVDALRPGGILLMECFNPQQRLRNRTSGGPGRMDMLYTPELLQLDFRDLQIELLEEKTVELREGLYHHGAAEVIRLIARKV